MLISFVFSVFSCFPLWWFALKLLKCFLYLSLNLFFTRLFFGSSAWSCFRFKFRISRVVLWCTSFIRYYSSSFLFGFCWRRITFRFFKLVKINFFTCSFQASQLFIIIFFGRISISFVWVFNRLFSYFGGFFLFNRHDFFSRNFFLGFKIDFSYFFELNNLWGSFDYLASTSNRWFLFLFLFFSNLFFLLIFCFNSFFRSNFFISINLKLITQ